jgi:hypothetical protein
MGAAALPSNWQIPMPAPATCLSSYHLPAIGFPLRCEIWANAFTLPFMEYYLLAKRLIEQPSKASSYFSLDSDEFDYPTFTLYAEMGAAPELVLKIRERLDETIEELAGQRAAGSILLDNELFPALLRNREQLLESLQKSLEKAEDDVRLDRDQTHEKQQLLDVNDEVRDEATAQIAEARRAQANVAGDRDLSIESRAAAIWSTAVILLGSGAERLEAQVKRELIGRIVNISELMVDRWTRVNNTIDFTKIKADIQERHRHRANSLATQALKKQNINIVNLSHAMVDLLEFLFLLQPLITVMTFLCD